MPEPGQAQRPRTIWLVSAVAIAVVVACPMLISDPAMWAYVLDPELLALVVVVGIQFARLQFGVWLLQLRGWPRRGRTHRTRER
jgi:hypothetical protein